jgi:UDP-glucose 4-epimerase
VKNILVTGGAGFIGSHTAVELCSAGYIPIIIDDFSNSDKSVMRNLEKITKLKLKLYEGRFQDKSLLEKVLGENKITGVIHFAAFKSVAESIRNPLKYYDNNVAGLITLLEVLGKNRIDRLIFSSSCIVYGEADKLPVGEDLPFKPALSPYGASKQMCEEIIRDAATKSLSLKGISLRYFNVIGAHPSGLIGDTARTEDANLVTYINRAAAGELKELIVYGDDYDTFDGTCVRDFTHVVDLAIAHVKAMDHLLRHGTKYYDAFNIGTGKGNTVLQMIKAFQKATGQKVPYKIGPRRLGDIIKSYADVNKAKRILSWQAQRSLEIALYDSWRWQQALNKRGNSG